jgi:hypothetical protein
MDKFFWVLRDPIVGDGGGSATITTPPPAGTPPASVSTSLNLPAAATPPPATPPAFTIPDAYKDKSWAKGIDSMDKLWAMNDGAQELIGKRPAGIPAADAPQAEWDKFYEATGRPKAAAEYVFDYGKNADGTSKVAADVKWDTGLKELLFKNGITAKQAVGLQKEFDALVANTLKERNIVVEQENQDFTKITTEIFGAERDKVLANGKTLLNEHITDPRVKAMLPKLSNDGLTILASALKSFSDKFIKSPGASTTAPGAPGSSTAGTVGGGRAEMHAEARRLMGTPEYTNSMHPDNAKVLARVSQLYQDAAKLPG